MPERVAVVGGGVKAELNGDVNDASSVKVEAIGNTLSAFAVGAVLVDLSRLPE